MSSASCAQVLKLAAVTGLAAPETCGRSPCDLGKQLRASAAELTVHVISYRTENYSWVGESSILDTKCLAEENNGYYITAYNYQELVEAFEKALDCPMIAESPSSWTSEPIGNVLELRQKVAKIE